MVILFYLMQCDIFKNWRCVSVVFQTLPVKFLYLEN